MVEVPDRAVTLASYGKELITAQKKFILQGQVIKLFTAVIYEYS
jgi:hypothetical protein